MIQNNGQTIIYVQVKKFKHSTAMKMQNGCPTTNTHTHVHSFTTYSTWNQPPTNAYSARTTTYFKNRYNSTAHSFHSENQTHNASATTTFQTSKPQYLTCELH